MMKCLLSAVKPAPLFVLLALVACQTGSPEPDLPSAVAAPTTEDPDRRIVPPPMPAASAKPAPEAQAADPAEGDDDTDGIDSAVSEPPTADANPGDAEQETEPIAPPPTPETVAVPDVPDTTAGGPPPPGGPAVEGTFSPAQMQDAVRNFADQYRQTIATACDFIIINTDEDADLRRRAQYTKINGATAMYDIAVDPVPASALLNAAVLVSLQTNFVRVNGQELFGDYTPMLLQRAEYLQEEAFRICARVMSDDQRRDLLNLINQWSQNNPTVIDFWYVRLRDLPGVRGGGVNAMLGSLTNLPGNFLNAFNPFAKAQDSVGEVQLLAERTAWLAPRLMILAQWRAEAVVYDTIANTRVSEALDLGERYAEIAEDLPAVLDQQRDALFQTLEEKQQPIESLLGEVNDITANANTLLISADALTGRIQEIQKTAIENDNAAPPDPDAPPARPFDITEYTEAAREVDDILVNATTLLASADSATTPEVLQPRVDLIADTVRNLIYTAAGSLLVVGLLLILAAKAIPRRQPKPSPA